MRIRNRFLLQSFSRMVEAPAFSPVSRHLGQALILYVFKRPLPQSLSPVAQNISQSKSCQELNVLKGYKFVLKVIVRLRRETRGIRDVGSHLLIDIHPRLGIGRWDHFSNQLVNFSPPILLKCLTLFVTRGKLCARAQQPRIRSKSSSGVHVSFYLQYWFS